MLHRNLIRQFRSNWALRGQHPQGTSGSRLQDAVIAVSVHASQPAFLGEISSEISTEISTNYRGNVGLNIMGSTRMGPSKHQATSAKSRCNPFAAGFGRRPGSGLVAIALLLGP